MEKYYIPVIDDFCFGFEYERKDWDKKGVLSWDKRCVKTIGQFNTIYANLRDPKIDGCSYRVKYLDKEDIESLDFKLDKEDKSIYIHCGYILGGDILDSVVGTVQ